MDSFYRKVKIPKFIYFQKSFRRHLGFPGANSLKSGVQRDLTGVMC
jgi:hypothetical protein